MALIDKMNQLDSTVNKSMVKSANVASMTPVEDEFNAKITKIYNNKNIDNEQKIKELSDIFLEGMIPFYKETAKNLVTNSSMQSFEEALAEDQRTKALTVDPITQKYQAISVEYQN